jgi:hypothetical protein
MNLPRNKNDRILWGIVSPIMFLFIVPFIILSMYWHTNGIESSIARFVVGNILFLFASTFLLVFIWCIFTPQWVDRILLRRTGRLVVISVILVIGLTMLMLATANRGAF